MRASGRCVNGETQTWVRVEHGEHAQQVGGDTRADHGGQGDTRGQTQDARVRDGHLGSGHGPVEVASRDLQLV